MLELGLNDSESLFQMKLCYDFNVSRYKWYSSDEFSQTYGLYIHGLFSVLLIESGSFVICLLIYVCLCIGQKKSHSVETQNSHKNMLS